REAGFVIAAAGLIGGEEGPEVAGIGARGGDQEDGKGIELAVQANTPEMIVVAVETNEPVLADANEARLGGFRVLANVPAELGGIGPDRDRLPRLEGRLPLRLPRRVEPAGVEPQFQAVLDRQARVRPRLGGTRTNDTGNEKGEQSDERQSRSHDR